MKDIIVIEETKEFRPHPALREGVNCIDTKYCKYEKEPTNWEELIELCKKIKNSRIKIAKEEDTIIITPKKDCSFKIMIDICGDIYTNQYMTVAEDITPARMWQIIKNLIGEE